VDFLHSTSLVVSQARLPNYMYYSGMDFTYKLDRTTVTVGELGFRGRLLFSLGCYCSSSSSSRGRLWPAFFYRNLRLGSTRRLLCHLWYGLFYGGGWTEAPLSRSAHRVPVVLLPLIRGVG
jgi:hypothetical protein